MFGTRSYASLAAGMLLLAACAGRAPVPQGAEPAPRGVTLQVVNHNWSDVDIYAVASGLAVRLGRVSSGGTGRFSIPPSVLGATDLRLLVAPFASSVAHITGDVLLAPGDTVKLTVENRLSLTSWVIAG